MIDPVVALASIAGGVFVFAALLSATASHEAVRDRHWSAAAGHAILTALSLAGWTGTAILIFWHVKTILEVQ